MSHEAGFSYESPTVPASALFIAGTGVSPVFPSLDAAERALSPRKAEKGCYPAAFGPSGQRYRVTGRRNRVGIEPSAEPDAPEELRQLLLQHLRCTHQAVDDRLSLPELTDQVWRLESEFWRVNDPYGERFSKHAPWYCCAGFLIAAAALVYFLVRLV